MSFGFGVGDFLAVGQLVLTLYNACNGAPGELSELQKDLSSLHILLSGLSVQAQDPNSLLLRKGGTKRPAWLQIRENLESTLKELNDLVKRYESMDRKAWMRVQLGLKNLTDLRGKLAFHLQAMNTLFGGITLSSLGRIEEGQARMELQLGKFDAFMSIVAPLLLQAVSEERAGHKAPTVLSAHEKGEGLEWDRMTMELVVAGVSREELEQNSERIREVLDWAVNNGPDLDDLQEVQIGDSLSCHGSNAEEDVPPTAGPSRDGTYGITTALETTGPKSTPPHSAPSSPGIPVYKPAEAIDLKILIIDDTLGHFGVMFKHYLDPMITYHKFGPGRPGNHASVLGAWRPVVDIELCGANADHARYIMNQRHDAKLEAPLRKQGNITWKRSLFRSSKGLNPGLYDFILIVPTLDEARAQLKNSISVRLLGIDRDVVAVSATDQSSLRVTSSTNGGAKRTVLDPILVLDNVFQITNFSLGRVEVKEFSPSVILPYRTGFTLRSEEHYFKVAARQVKACALGFIEDVLLGKRMLPGVEEYFSLSDLNIPKIR